MTPDEEQALRLAVAHDRDQRHATLFLLSFSLACETHPEIVREAVSRAFDLSGYEEQARRVGAELAALSQKARELSHYLAAVRADLERIEGRIDLWHLDNPPAPQNGKPAANGRK